LDPASATYGQGPCVERKGSLYVFDQGVLTAFDLANGNARWRLPSVGIAGLFFDDRDMMYVNATTASHESLKYSRQIDLSQKVTSVVLKVDSRNGKILWSTQSSGMVNYVSGKFIFSVQEYMPQEEDEDNPYKPETGFEAQPYLRIRRLNPANGHEMWQHFQQRAPLDVAFDKNTIRLVFKKEVQVLRFFSL
jgi:outer membrane protein assembly factor BamB